MLTRLVLLLALTFSPAVLAAAPHWVPVGPYGGLVSTLTVVDPAASQTLYATSLYQGSFKSLDGGATWIQMHAGPVSGNVAVDPGRPTTIYESFNFNQVAKSVDGGATWRSSGRGLPQSQILAIAVDPAKHSRVYVAGNSLWRSLDGGLSWHRASQGLPKVLGGLVSALAVPPGPAGTLYAATGGGVFKSIDAGNSWKPASQGLPAGKVWTLALAPSNPQVLWASCGLDAVFRSTNGGTSWSAAGRPAAGGSIVTSLAVAPGDPSTAWAGTFDHGVYRTNDAGAHWTPVGPHSATEVAALAATATSLYAGVFPDFRDPGGVLASSDGGTTWQTRNRGLLALTAYDLAIDPHHPEMLWTAAGVTGLYRSTVGGRDWDLSAQPPSPPFSPLSPPFVFNAAFSADGAHLYAVFNFQLWESDDAGASWRISLTTGATSGILSVLTHPADASTLYARDSQKPYVSHDSGASWQALSSPGFHCALDGIALAPSAPATLYALGSNQTDGLNGCRSPTDSIARSTDGGATWVAANHGLQGTIFSFAVDPFDARILYAQTFRGLSKSTDGGANWSRVAKTTGGNLVFSTGGGTLWEASGSQVFASHNGGATWHSAGGPQAFIQHLIPDPANADRLYAVTDGGVWVLEP